jgi:GDP-L-fucose synthase
VEVTAWGTGNASREFLFARDAADAIVRAAVAYDGPEPLNIGSGREVTIRELAELIARHAGFRGRIVWDAAQPDGQPRRCLDTSRALAEIGFRAATALEDGLRETITWFEATRHADFTPLAA